MRHLLNTLFVTSEDIYLSLDGENVVANRDKQVVARYPRRRWVPVPSGIFPWHSARPGANSWHGHAGKAAETSCCAGNSIESRMTRRKAA